VPKPKLSPNNFCILHLNGGGAGQNQVKAAEFYGMACSGGDSGGWYVVGMLFELATNTPLDLEKTSRFCRNARDAGGAGRKAVLPKRSKTKQET
jgi:TPR repeat protein